MKKILAALDQGDTRRQVFNQALKLAQLAQSRLHLLSVLPPQSDTSLSVSPYSDRDLAAYAEAYRALRTESMATLEDFSQQAQAAGIESEFTHDAGNPGPAICRLAKTWGADLILVGSHGRRGLSEMLLGSVSNYVVHHAPCSVMVIHGEPLGEEQSG